MYLSQGVVLGKEPADGLAINLAGGEVDEALVALDAVLDLREISVKLGARIRRRREANRRQRSYHGEGVDEVAEDGVERASVVVGRGADGSQVDDLTRANEIIKK